jgi:hypothetical protein
MRKEEETGRRFVFNDVRVMAYPRSGHTWIKGMTRLLMRRVCGDRTKRLRNLVMFKHDGGAVELWGPHRHRFSHRYVEDKRRYSTHRVIVLTRDPRDIVVSAWHLLSGRHGRQITLHDYVWHELGFPFIIRWMGDWARQRRVPREFHLLRYEDFLGDPVGQLRQLVEIAGLRNVPDDVYEDVVDVYSFANCRQDDQRNVTPWASQRLGRDLESVGEHALCVRRGRVGGWRGELSEADQRRTTDFMAKRLDPIYGYE